MPLNAVEGYFSTRGTHLPVPIRKRHPNANLQILGCWTVYRTKCIITKKIDRVNLILPCCALLSTLSHYYRLN